MHIITKTIPYLSEEELESIEVEEKPIPNFKINLMGKGKVG
jgi:hypothetical protein